MRAELVAIHVALDRLSYLKDFCLFTDSLSCLQAIQKCLYNTDPQAYHHHQVLIDDVVRLIMEREHKGLRTTLKKVRAHTNVLGNELADATAKRAVRQFDDLSEETKIKVSLGAVAPRPPYWIMYTHAPPTPPTEMAVGTHTMTLRTPWYHIPEEDRLHMRAFTRPSKQLRSKVRLLRSLLHTSLYRRLILRAIGGGARTAPVGRALHSRITRRPGEGTAILKFLHGQYYTGKLAFRYGHAPSDACQLCGLPDSCTHVAGEITPTTPTISLASTTRRANSPIPPSARRSRGAVPSTPHTRYKSCQQTPEPSPKPPDPSLKALVLPPRPLLWAQETQITGLTHPRMTPSPNSPCDIRDTSMSPRTSGTSYASRRRPPMMAKAPLHQTSSRIGS